MTPERWCRLREVFVAALETPEPERPQFLESACEGDTELRAEVERLLAGNQDPSWQSPATLLFPVTAELAPGDMVGHYRVEAKLGEGGMGVVYKAYDTRLHREVALKLLPPGPMADPDRMQRLMREARAASALSHSNIVTVYEVGSELGLDFIALEYVEGQSLAHAIPAQGLPLACALGYAVEIAAALAKAHAAGIVHRDLKPANIMLTGEGHIKLLDFGLARRVPTAASETASVTAEGEIAGTIGYMSPEQADGKIANRRADIWSFGAVLYEMLSGRRAFVGESAADILASVLKLDPDWNLLPAETPASIRRLIQRCLRKDPKQRLRAIGEARIEIEAALAEESAADSAFSGSLIQKHKKAAVGSVAIVAALVALAWFLLNNPPKLSAELTQKRLTFNSSENPVQSEAISSDGKYLAYSYPAGIRVKLLSTSEERLIPRPAGVPAGAYWNVDSWFPDGAQLLADAYEPGGHHSIWTVSVLGQSPRQLREGAVGFEVSPNGTHIAFGRSHTSHYISEIWVMGTQGDNPRKVLAVGENDVLSTVHWSPNGQRLAYIRYQGTGDRPQASIETCDLKGTSRAVVLSADPLLHDFCWLPEGRIVYARRDSPDSADSNLWQIGIDNHAGTLTGKSKRITQWAGYELSGLRSSADGKRLAFHKSSNQVKVYLGELAAGGMLVKSPRLLNNDEGYVNPTAWTPDSKAILVDSNRNGTFGIYKQGINQETVEPVFTGPQNAEGARMTADGAWILFFETQAGSANPAPVYHLMRIPASGGVPQFVLESRNPVDVVCARAPASRCVIVETSQDQKELFVTAFDPLKGRGKVFRTVLKDPSQNYGATALSPDGSTYAVSQSGEPEIHIRFLSLSGGSDREITLKGWPNVGGLDWSTDGKGLYCGSQTPQAGTLLYIELSGNSRVVWQNKGGGGLMWGLPSPDGRYLAIQAAVTNSNVWMVEGF